MVFQQTHDVRGTESVEKSHLAVVANPNFQAITGRGDQTAFKTRTDMDLGAARATVDNKFPSVTIDAGQKAEAGQKSGKTTPELGAAPPAVDAKVAQAPVEQRATAQPITETFVVPEQYKEGERKKSNAIADTSVGRDTMYHKTLEPAHVVAATHVPDAPAPVTPTSDSLVAQAKPKPVDQQPATSAAKIADTTEPTRPKLETVASATPTPAKNLDNIAPIKPRQDMFG